jgi:aldehyde dehydrogenase (NAD+)
MSAPLHPFLADPAKKLLIGGRWVEARSGRSFEARNPATGALLGTVAEGGAEDIDIAVADARRAFEGPWSRALPSDRQRILLKLADLVEQRWEELALLDTLDMGAPIRHTRAPRDLLVGLLRYYAGQALALHGDTLHPSVPDMFACTLKEPVGVVGGIIPWNGPLWACVWKIGPVLATGCTLVLKPAEEASLTPLLFAQLVLEAGAPEGVVNVVTGAGPGAGAALAAHMGVDKVSFTGSNTTGRKIVEASAGNLKRLTLELGGKSPNIIFADADLEAAAPTAAMAVFANAGQICSAGTRVFVQRPVYEAVLEAMAKVGASVKVGDGMDPETDMGPVVSQRQLERVSSYLDTGCSDGARLVCGGSRLTDGRLGDGFFIAPTIFADVDNSSRLAREEIFGPVAAVIPFDGEDEVVAMANDNDFGLGAGVWTRDGARAHRMGRRLQAGSVWVNCYNALDPVVPFGGVKMSGYGRECGREHLEDYLTVKAFWMKTV